MKFKKVLSIGVVAAIIAPLPIVIACGTAKDSKNPKKIAGNSHTPGGNGDSISEKGLWPAHTFLTNDAEYAKWWNNGNPLNKALVPTSEKDYSYFKPGKATYDRTDKVTSSIKIVPYTRYRPTYIIEKARLKPSSVNGKPIAPPWTRHNVNDNVVVKGTPLSRTVKSDTENIINRVLDIIKYPILGDNIRFAKENSNHPERIYKLNAADLEYFNSKRTIAEKVNYLFYTVLKFNSILDADQHVANDNGVKTSLDANGTEWVKSVIDYIKLKGKSFVDNAINLHTIRKVYDQKIGNPYFIWNTDEEFTSIWEPHLAYSTSDAEILTLGKNWTQRMLPMKEITRNFKPEAIIEDTWKFDKTFSKTELANLKADNYIVHTWDADNTKNIEGIMEKMATQVGFNIPDGFANFGRPFDIAKYLVDMYNNNGGGKMAYVVTYKGRTELVKINMQKTFEKLIKTLDNPDGTPKITPESKFPGVKSIGSAISATLSIKGMSPEGLLHSLGLLGDVKNLLGHELLEIPDSHDPTLWAKVDKVLGLPGETLMEFGNMIKMFEDLAHVFTTSPLAKQWAKDHNQTKDTIKDKTQPVFEDLRGVMIRRMMRDPKH